MYVTPYVDRAGWKAVVGSEERNVQLSTTNDNEIYIEGVELDVGDMIIFKNTAKSLEQGYAQIKDACPSAIFLEAGTSNELKVKTDGTGTYNFYIDLSASKGIWVVKQGYTPAVTTNYKLVGTINSLNKWNYSEGLALTNADSEIQPSDLNTSHQWKVQVALKAGDQIKMRDGQTTESWLNYTILSNKPLFSDTDGDNHNIGIRFDGTYVVYLKELKNSEGYQIYIHLNDNEVPTGATLFDWDTSAMTYNPFQDNAVILAKLSGGASADKWVDVTVINDHSVAVQMETYTTVKLGRFAPGTTAAAAVTPWNDTQNGTTSSTTLVWNS